MLTAVGLAAVVVFASIRFQEASQRGAAGLSYIEVTGAEGRVFGLGPGDVMMAYPGSEADRAGIGRGDRLLSIDGIPIDDTVRLRELDQRVRSGDTVVYRLERDGVEREVGIRFRPLFRDRWAIVSIVVHTLVALSFVLIGVLVFTRKPDDRRVLVFYAMVIVGALSIFGSALLAIDNSSVRGIIVAPSHALLPVAVISVFVVAFLPLTLHLALVFPHDRPVLREHPQILGWVYGVPLLAALLVLGLGSFGAIVPMLSPAGTSRLDTAANVILGALAVGGLILALRLARRAQVEGWLHAIVRQPGHSLLAIFGALLGVVRVAAALKLKILTITATAFTVLLPFLALAAFPVLACVALYRSYREAGVEEKRQVKWPLWGTLIALATKIVFSLVLYALITYVMVTGRNLTEWTFASQMLQLVPVVVYLLIPVSFAFAILKYRLMNIDVIIRKTVAYAILSGAIVILYLVLVGGLGTVLIRSAGVQNQTMVIASTLVVALLFVPIRNKLQTLVDRNLFPHRYDYPAALQAITVDARNATDLAALLRSSGEKVQQALQNRSVVLFVERQDEYVAMAKVGVSDAVLGTLRLPHSFVSELDRPFDPRRRNLEDHVSSALARLDTVLVLPLATRGFIALAPKLSGAVFDVEDIEFLLSASGEIVAGADRLRMQTEEVDFAQARAIQQSLLPREMPRVADLDVTGEWQPARNMGGDYYDLLELGPRELAVCIGDVAGKGMSAALLMSGLQAAVRASASSSPRELCERVRRVVVSSLSGGRFVTFFYATVDTGAWKIRWCNAGHNAPILVRADGSTFRLEGGGPAFSRLFRQDAYVEHEMALTPGDRVVLFTDGVSEASDPRGEQLGEGRLEDLVRRCRAEPAGSIQREIVDAALTHSGGELDDDLTLVVVAVTGRNDRGEHLSQDRDPAAAEVL
jgi:serine phosphatase RsbU (regulator of sigma subunit)